MIGIYLFQLSAFLIALILGLLFTMIVKKIALKLNIVDNPNDTFAGRRIHKKITPLMGGVAIFLSFNLVIFCIAFFFPDYLLGDWLRFKQLVGILIGSLVLMIGGVCDDKYSLSAKKTNYISYTCCLGHYW
jgi:UDP-GlcNAc:undecaprenyl-phosphate GlcNAc-1-phosphate transferase